MTRQATRPLISFEGPRVCDSDGQVLAELHGDGQWRTPDGQLTTGLELPVEKVSASVSPAERARHQAEQDQTWLAGAIPAVAELAAHMRTITTDEVWSVLTMPPREPRQLGALMRACQRRGLIEPTKEHRPSNRPINNRRPLLVWRSLIDAGHPPAGDPTLRQAAGDGIPAQSKPTEGIAMNKQREERR